jgi:hypothetical protein
MTTTTYSTFRSHGLLFLKLLVRTVSFLLYHLSSSDTRAQRYIPLCRLPLRCSNKTDGEGKPLRSIKLGRSESDERAKADTIMGDRGWNEI